MRGYEETSFFWNDVVRYKSTQFYSKNTTLFVFSRQQYGVVYESAMYSSVMLSGSLNSLAGVDVTMINLFIFLRSSNIIAQTCIFYDRPKLFSYST
jgi:hypothetical protein